MAYIYGIIITMKKTCKQCGEEKPFDRDAPQNSKDSGFMGRVCWECYKFVTKLANREASRKFRSTPEGRAKHNAASVKCSMKRRKVDGWFRLRQQLAVETRQLMKQLAQGRGEDYRFQKIFGQSRDVVFAHIDQQLLIKGFMWEGHGHEWVLDHITPLGLAQSNLELLELCRLENTQVLSVLENARKGVLDQLLIRGMEAEA